VLRDNQNPVVSDIQRHVHWLQSAGIEQSAVKPEAAIGGGLKGQALQPTAQSRRWEDDATWG